MRALVMEGYPDSTTARGLESPATIVTLCVLSDNYC